MKLQFDAKQPYQVDAVSAVVDLFDGQPLNQPDYATILQTFDTGLFGSVRQTDLGIGNKLILEDCGVTFGNVRSSRSKRK